MQPFAQHLTNGNKKLVASADKTFEAKFKFQPSLKPCEDSSSLQQEIYHSLLQRSLKNKVWCFWNLFDLTKPRLQEVTFSHFSLSCKSSSLCTSTPLNLACLKHKYTAHKYHFKCSVRADPFKWAGKWISQPHTSKLLYFHEWWINVRDWSSICPNQDNFWLS